MRILTLDFETQPIGPRPDHYPPEPAGAALREHNGRSYYLAWGHPEGNNTTPERGRDTLVNAIIEHDSILCHSATFDIAVLEERLGVGVADKQLHDTMVLAFMVDPYGELGLKPLAERHLGMPPEEQDAVREWLIANKVVRKGATKQWGAHIAKAPASVVGPYAIGDVERTWALFEKLRPLVDSRAYEREMKVVRICIEMERKGIHVDTDALVADTAAYEKVLDSVHTTIRTVLRAPSLELSNGAQLANALEARYGVDLPLTATGKKSTAKDTVMGYVPDPYVKALLLYEASLSYNLKNYMRPFSEQAQRTGGIIHAQWHSVRGDKGGGARTGRFSSSPNLQNLKDPEGEERFLKMLNELHPHDWRLPSIRSYVVAPRGYLVVGRDYSQIELRITGHYEDGPMAANYVSNPDWDLHAWVIERVREMFEIELPRRIAKNVGFGIVYGAGGRAISQQAGVSYDQAVEFKNMYLKVLPSLKALMDGVRDVGRRGGSITTLGGRQYKCEPKREVDGEERSFEYKLLNYLVQGSAADLMKEAMIKAYEYGLDLRLTVHDEPVIYAPEWCWGQHMKALKHAMEENDLAKALDVPVTTNGYMGMNWTDTEDCE